MTHKLNRNQRGIRFCLTDVTGSEQSETDVRKKCNKPGKSAWAQRIASTKCSTLPSTIPAAQNSGLIVRCSDRGMAGNRRQLRHRRPRSAQEQTTTEQERLRSGVQSGELRRKHREWGNLAHGKGFRAQELYAGDGRCCPRRPDATDASEVSLYRVHRLRSASNDPGRLDDTDRW